MAIQRFRLALNNASFPFVSTEAPRATFVPGLDLPNRAPRGYVAGPESADYNLTQIIYGENFMPVGSGVRSVGYKQIIAPTVNTDFDSVFPCGIRMRTMFFTVLAKARTTSTILLLPHGRLRRFRLFMVSLWMQAQTLQTAKSPMRMWKAIRLFASQD